MDSSRSEEIESMVTLFSLDALADITKFLRTALKTEAGKLVLVSIIMANF